MSTDSLKQDRTADAAAWINPTDESGGISQYWDAIRGSRWLILAAVISCLGAGVVTLSLAEKTYESSSYVVVTPVSDRDGAYTGLSLLRESADPSRNLETLSKAITTPLVARRVKENLGLSGSPRSLLNGVSAVPVAQSDLIEIRVRATNPKLAQRLANAFATATIEHRTARLHVETDKIIAGLQPLVGRARSTPASESEQFVAQRLAQLQALRAGPDPTIRLDTPAELPTAQAWPKPKLTIIVSLIAGLLVGVGASFGLQLIDPRVRSERQLRELYRLPILARIPVVKRRSRFLRRPRAPAYDSFQSLRLALMTVGRDAGPDRSVFLTGPSRRDGKTTTAIGLARALASSGQRTTLVETDARNPSIGNVMGIKPSEGLLAVATGATPLSEALVHPDEEPSDLSVLLVERSVTWLPDVLSSATADRLLSELDEVSDWVVLDSAPLSQVSDALPLAILADQILLVVRMGKSQLKALKLLTETLSQYDIRPTGFVVIGGAPPPAYAA